MELHKLAHQTGEDDLLCRIRGGDSSALATMFDRHRGRLEKMVRLRLDSRLRGRIDPADVLQDAFVDAARRLAEFAGNAMPLFLWLRFLTSQRFNCCIDNTSGRRATPSVRSRFIRALSPQADSMSLARQLLGRLTTPSEGAIRVEMRLRVHDALNAMDPIDREVLAYGTLRN